MRPSKPDVPQIQARLRSAYPDAHCALDHRDPFQLVVATILISFVALVWLIAAPAVGFIRLATDRSIGDAGRETA